VDYRDEPKVRLLSDNLNTHNITSVYKTFPHSEAHRLARRIEMIHTPRNGSWLKVAQCLKCRISTVEELESEVSAWQKERNDSQAKVVWQFTTNDARVKLKHLYPIFEMDDQFNSIASF